MWWWERRFAEVRNHWKQSGKTWWEHRPDLYDKAVAEYLELKSKDMLDYNRFAPSQAEEFMEQELQETECAMASMRESWKKHGHNVKKDAKELWHTHHTAIRAHSMLA